LARIYRIGLWLALASSVLGLLLAAAKIPAPNQEVRNAAAWVLVAGGVCVMLRLALFAWSVLRPVRACEWDPRVLKAERYAAGLTIFPVAPVIAIAMVVVWWPWPRGVLLAAVTACILGSGGAYLLEVLYLSQWPRRLAAWLLARRLPRFQELLHSRDAREREKAARAMRHMFRHASPAAPDLIEALKDESAEVRSQAVLAIYFSWATWSIPPNDLNLAAALRPLLRDPDPRARIVAAGMFVDLGVATAPEVLPALSEGIVHPDDQFADAIAAGSLGQLGPDAAPAMPALRAALFDRQPPNIGAIFVLAKLGEPGVPVLAEALTHPDPSVREWAASCLGEMDKVAVATLPALRVAGRDRSERVRRAATIALKRIAGD
jgi:hypothetical protein